MKNYSDRLIAKLYFCFMDSAIKRKNIHQLFILSISVIGFVFMLLWQTKHSGHPDNYWSPIIWTIAGLLLIIPFYFGKYERQPLNNTNLYFNLLIVGGLTSVGLFASYYLHTVFIEYPVTPKGSDVIPSLEVYVRRFLAGEKVYTIIPFSNYEVWPTYFPAMWMPYILPELLGFDYRWMAFGCFYLSYTYIAYQSLKNGKNFLLALVVILLPYLTIMWHINYDVSVFAYATELMPITFYMWLIYGLFRKNYLLIGVMLALCTMSRYAYTLWIIPFVSIIWMEEGFKTILRIGIIGSAVILGIYVIPFLIWDPSILTDGLAYYSKTAEDQWKIQFWQGEDATIPFHLDNGLSFSYWFYQFVEGDHLAKHNIASKFHLGVTALLTVIITLSFRYLKKRINWNDYLVFSLFLYLLFFYTFIYVPFSYLFMLPLIVGLTIFVIYSNSFKKK